MEVIPVLDYITLPEVPQGSEVGIVVWFSVCVLIIVFGFATFIIRTFKGHLAPLASHVENINDATNHRHPGAPTLVDHVTATRVAVEDLQGRMAESHAQVQELRVDVAGLKTWAGKWGNLPAEFDSDTGLAGKFEAIDQDLAIIRDRIVNHIQWEEDHKWSDIEKLIEEKKS